MHRVRIFEHVRGASNAQEAYQSIFLNIIRPALVELTGTFLLVLLSLWNACQSNGELINGALCGGFTLIVLLASFGHISGTHLNPCVTLGVFIAGEVRIYLAIIYILMQIIGSIGAAGMLRLIVSSNAYESCFGGVTLLNAVEKIGWRQGLAIEFFITYLLVTVILLVALDTKSKTGLASLIIGFALAGNILSAGGLTGASMNPARSFGPAIVANIWKDHWIYWIGPLSGAGLAGVLYRFIWAHNDRRWPKQKPKILTETPIQ